MCVCFCLCVSVALLVSRTLRYWFVSVLIGARVVWSYKVIFRGTFLLEFEDDECLVLNSGTVSVVCCLVDVHGE